MRFKEFTQAHELADKMILTSFPFARVELECGTVLDPSDSVTRSRERQLKVTFSTKPNESNLSSASMKRRKCLIEGIMLSPTWYLKQKEISEDVE